MEIPHRSLLPLLCATLVTALSGQAMAAGEEWLKQDGAATGWPSALPVFNARRAALVMDAAGETRLRAVVLAAPMPAAPAGAAFQPRTDEFLKRFSETPEAALKIEWFDGGVPPTRFIRAIHLKDGRVESSYRLGDAAITRTVITSDEDDAVFIHLLADKPGALSFRVSLENAPAAEVRIEDRRQIIFSPERGIASHVWVIPFESDVATEGKAIAIRGEGEAMIIWSFATAGDEAEKSLAGTLRKLGDRYDPGQSPPDPVRIWHGILGKRLKSVENSP